MRLGNDLMKFRTMRFMKQVELKFGQPVRGHHCNKYLNTASHFSCVFLLFESLHKHVSNEFNYELSSNTMDFNKKKLIACFFVKLHFLGKKNILIQSPHRFHSSRYPTIIATYFIDHLWISIGIFHAWGRLFVQFMLYSS